MTTQYISQIMKIDIGVMIIAGMASFYCLLAAVRFACMKGNTKQAVGEFGIAAVLLLVIAIGAMENSRVIEHLQSQAKKLQEE